MRVFLAGATGAIGRRLVAQLVARGHRVTATTTRPKKVELLRALGAEPVVVDGLDAVAVGEAVARAEREAIVHQMTALAGLSDLKRFGISLQLHEVNGQPGALVLDSEGRLTNVFSIEIVDGTVQAVRSVINPDKLHHLGPVADVWALLRARRSSADPPAP
jgi:NAD(P)-dependent dehydrogenase (short-subunit alcohol dehydrogenase family)